MSEEVYIGKVLFFSAVKGFGFIAWEREGVSQKDMFIHYSDIQVEGFKQVKEGQKVEFKIGKNNAGNPKAIELKIIG